jgi:hypothetical protein
MDGNRNAGELGMDRMAWAVSLQQLLHLDLSIASISSQKNIGAPGTRTWVAGGAAAFQPRGLSHPSTLAA